MEESIQEKPNLQKSVVRVLGSGKRGLIFSRIKRRILRHVWFVRGLILGFFLVLFYFLLVLVGNFIRETRVGYYLVLAKDFVFTPSEKIKSSDGRTNILILGKSGKGHAGEDLTDTIMFTSINHTDPTITLISIPRDIWISDLRTKLNSIYYWGNQKQENGGMVLAKATVEEIVGQPVHYAVVVDFLGFKEIIDTLDGIEVDVERGFVDERYPIPGKENDLCGGDPQYRCRYETVRFEKGRQYMDGETALKFVRSRNAEGEEGTDFARASRQQKVIRAIKEKVLSKEILLSPKKLLSLKGVVLGAVETDIPESGLVVFARRVIQADDKIFSFVLPEDLLVNPTKSPRYDNQYVFIPKNEGWGEIHEWVKCVLDKSGCE